MIYYDDKWNVWIASIVGLKVYCDSEKSAREFVAKFYDKIDKERREADENVGPRGD